MYLHWNGSEQRVVLLRVDDASTGQRVPVDFVVEERPARLTVLLRAHMHCLKRLNHIRGEGTHVSYNSHSPEKDRERLMTGRWSKQTVKGIPIR